MDVVDMLLPASWLHRYMCWLDIMHLACLELFVHKKDNSFVRVKFHG